MATVPTGKMERELRKLYLQWASRMPTVEYEMSTYLQEFADQSVDLIERMGGEIARLGVSAGFPAPKRLDLAGWSSRIYSELETASIQASIMSGLNARDAALAMYKAGAEQARWRLQRLARTETVNAYWQNQRAEAADLGLVLLWSMEDGPRTCEWCRERDGLVAEDGCRDHPNGRCTLLPTLPSEVRYRGSVRPDGTVWFDEDWNKNTQPKSTTKDFSPEETALTPYTFSQDELNAGRYLAIGDDYALSSPKAWSVQEKAAMTNYQAPDIAYYVNGSLRGYDDLDDFWFTQIITESEDAFKSHMDSAIAKGSLTETQTLFRGMKMSDELLSQYTPGSVVADKGYMSTSVMDKLATRFAGKNEDGWVMEIVAPKGQVAAPGAPSLGEVILPRDTRLRVSKIDKSSKKIYAEVVQ